MYAGLGGEYFGVEVLGIRLVKFRIGLVLSAKGGIFPVLCRPIRYLVGAVLGHGRAVAVVDTCG
jgi:NAD dependent epimerase/dehydratase family enzyme